MKDEEEETYQDGWPLNPRCHNRMKHITRRVHLTADMDYYAQLTKFLCAIIEVNNASVFVIFPLWYVNFVMVDILPSEKGHKVVLIR